MNEETIDEAISKAVDDFLEHKNFFMFGDPDTGDKAVVVAVRERLEPGEEWIICNTLEPNT